MSGNMRGVLGADLACYQQARQAGFRTTFRAFLSSQVQVNRISGIFSTIFVNINIMGLKNFLQFNFNQDLNKIVHYGDRETPVVNLRGEKLFESWSDIFRNIPMNDVPLYSFDRRNILQDYTW